MYTQTPGAFHMGGGYANPYAYRMTPYGTMFGQTGAGNSFGNFATNLPGYALTAGTAASMAGMFTSNAAVNAVGNTLGFGGLGMAASIPVSMLASAAAARFAEGGQQQMMSQDMLRGVFGTRNMGGAMGMGVSRNASSQFTDMFRQLATSGEMLTNNQELKSLFGKFTDMELGKMSRNVGDVSSRFKKLAETVRDMSKDLGTTLEGVMPTFQRQINMGFMDPDEIRRSAMRTRGLQSVGVGSSEATSAGLQQSQASANFAAGGEMRYGAEGATRNLGLVNVALEKGVLTEEDIMSSTGQRGERGAADLAQQMMQGTRQMMTSSGYGKYLSAYLGETDKDGRFTGKIDRSALERLATATQQEIEQMANKKISGSGTSFTAQMDAGMGANFASQMSGSDVAQMLKRIFESEGANSKDAMQLMLSRIGNIRGKTAQVMLKLMESQGTLTDEMEKQFREYAIRDRLPAELEERFSLERKIGRAARAVDRAVGDPIRAGGSAVHRGVGNYFDNIGEQFAYGGIGGGVYGLFGGGYGERASQLGAGSRVRGIANIINRGGARASRSLNLNAGNADTEMARSLTTYDETFGGKSRTVGGRTSVTHNVTGIDTETAQALMAGTYTFDKRNRELALRKFGGGSELGDEILRAADYKDFSSKVTSASKFGTIGMLTAFIQENEGKPDMGQHVEKAKKLLQGAKQHRLDLIGAQQLRDHEGTIKDVNRELNSILDTSGEGGLSRRFGMGDYNQIESAHMRELYESGKYDELGAINRVLSDETLLTAVLAAQSPQAQKDLIEKQTGVAVSDTALAEIQKFADTFMEKSDSLAQGVASYKRGVGGRLTKALDKRVTADFSARRRLGANDLQVLGEQVSSAYRTSSGSALKESLKSVDIKQLANSDMRKTLADFQGFAGKTAEQQKKFLQDSGFSAEQLANADSDRLLDMGLTALQAQSGNVQLDNSGLRAAAGYGNVKEVAEIVGLLREDTLRQMGETQKVTGEYVKVATDRIQELRGAAPH